MHTKTKNLELDVNFNKRKGRKKKTDPRKMLKVQLAQPM